MTREEAVLGYFRKWIFDFIVDTRDDTRDTDSKVIGVISNSYQRANDWFDEKMENCDREMIKNIVKSKNRLELVLTTGEVYRWHRADYTVRGRCFKSVVLDLDNIDFEGFEWILGACRYCTRENVSFMS